MLPSTPLSELSSPDSGDTKSNAEAVDWRKKSRSKHKNSRTGCATCKIRHVRCDETRPECLKCKGTGRKCDGYVLPANPDSNAARNHGAVSVSHSLIAIDTRIPSPSNFQKVNPLALRDSLLNFGGTKLEHRHLDFFYSQTAPSLAGHFDTEFWSVIVPQIACFEPSVQHAMVALASIHENCELGNTNIDGLDISNSPCGQFALRQYNKAIKHLKKYQTPSPQNTVFLLTTCILFICLEFMRGNLRLALRHIASGTLILKSQEAKTTTPSLESIEIRLRETFSRLSISATVNGFRVPLLQPDAMDTTSIWVDKPFSTLLSARNALNNIMASGLRFIETAMVSMEQQQSFALESLAATQTVFLSQLQLWKTNFEESAFPCRLSDPSITILMVSHLHAIIWLTAALYMNESAWDTQIPRFVGLVALCRSIVDSASEPVRKGPYSIVGLPRASPKRAAWRHAFTFEMGVIPALYFTALKCRDPKVRREAIGLLDLARPRKEGLWDAGSCQEMAWRVIKLEEEGILEGELPAEEKRTVTRSPRFTLYSATGADVF